MRVLLGACVLLDAMQNRGESAKFAQKQSFILGKGFDEKLAGIFESSSIPDNIVSKGVAQSAMNFLVEEFSYM